ncbi:MAG: homocysteine S-methyltransferase family protein [Eggerthellaceae bacterium]
MDNNLATNAASTPDAAIAAGAADAASTSANANAATANSRIRTVRYKDQHLKAALEGAEFLVQDGGMGTMLQAAGLVQEGKNPDLLALTNPEDIVAIQRAYVEAGAEMVLTTTFSSNRLKLEGQATVAEMFKAAADNARAAGARYVAADMGPTGSLLEPMGTLSFNDAYDLFAEQVDAAVAAGCDLIVLETLADLKEAKAALLAATEHSDLPVFVTMTFEEDGRTFLGTPPEVAAITLSSMGASAIGMNCSLGPKEVTDIAKTLVACSRVPVIIRPNAGLPRMEGDRTIYDITPEEFGEAMEVMADLGVNIMGGCCGTTPAFTAQLRKIADTRKVPAPKPAQSALIITSSTQAVTFEAGSPRIAMVGERINPTGKKKLKAALKANDLDYIIGEAVGQRDNGADILDVNVGLPEINEPEVLHAAVQKLQATVPLPLVIDSSDPEAVEAAVRDYAGKPLINSVNGKQENMDAILPIAAKYGCSVIALCLDESGIPSTAQARFDIAKRIVEEAATYGIPAHDIVVDCLTMAVATNQPEAMAILDGIKMVKSQLGCRTTLGVSNISFGLPQRNLFSSNFLLAAFGAGLDLPIINPSAERYRDAVLCYKVINGQDEGARAYIENRTQHDDPYDNQGVTADAGQVAAGVQMILQATGLAASDLGAAGAALAGAAGAAGAGASTGAGSTAAGAGAAGAGASTGAGATGGATGSAAAAGSASASTATSSTPVPIPEALADAAPLAQEIQELILAGRKEPMADATRKLLQGHDPLTLIDGLFIPCLDEVGVRFDKGTFFLPQLMASAEAVKVGFDVVKESMGDGASADASKGIILATVKGDIHDIGKNIVKMLLENYGYYVVDLGRDVAPEAVLAAAKETGIRLIGLSALMTTTVKSMEATISLLHQELPDVKTFVGGAVLTADYAQTMGADWYAKDAAESARIAEAYFSTSE